MSRFDAPSTTAAELAQHEDPQHEDRGAVLVMVLLASVVATLFVLPMLYYVSTVARASSIPTDKAAAVEMAEGGTWIALSNEAALYDLCVGGTLPSSLNTVTTTCEVIATETLRDPAVIPYNVATVQADQQVPVSLGVTNPYFNPNIAADPAAWLNAPDWSSSPSAGTVWLPQIPVRATSDGGTRDVTMLPGTQDPAYSSCRVFFPGSFNTPIEISEPAYFTSGVYYFKQPIVLKSGADVVVGNGEHVGCTNDAEAIAGADPLPNPLNMSGLGGTFVLGDYAQITIDDDGTDDIRFVMNQRYVAATETSVSASSNVSIVSVNGTHAPFTGTEALGDDLVVGGVLRVPASTIGTDASPLAANSGYLPSRLTPKPGGPAAPTITDTVTYQRDRSGDAGPTDRGRLTVTWTAPVDNGSPITSYTVTDATSGRTCSPATQPDYEVQTSCTITGLSNQSEDSGLHPVVTVRATNAIGTSASSVAHDADRIDLGGGDQISSADTPDSPQNLIVTDHANGISVSWDAPGSDGGSPISGYRVAATDTISGIQHTCTAWWNELSCNLATASGLTNGVAYDVEVVALQIEGEPAAEFIGDPEAVAGHVFTVSAAPLPDLTPVLPASQRLAILDFTVEHGANVDIEIAGYISVPQGRIDLGSASASTARVSLTGGVVAAEIAIAPSGAPDLDIQFENPIAQKRIRLVSVADGKFTATSTAIVQVNRSGSIAINSWIVQ